MKNFPWQAKNEVVLLDVKSHLLRQFLPKSWLYGGILLFGLFSAYLFCYGVFLLSILLVILILMYELFLWRWTRIMVTNKRIIKFVKNWIFSEHLKELNLNQVTEILAVKRWFLNKILTTGNVKFVGKDKETVIWFSNVKYPEEITMYVSRLKEFLKENTDFGPMQLKPFVPRKERIANS